MKFDGDVKQIAKAFVAARSEMSGLVAKDARGNYGKYMTLAALVEATAATFAQHGLAIVQEAGKNEMGVTVDTWLIHESGATMHFGTLTMPVGDGKPQAVGSALTYGRRYALAAACGIAPDDDDGQAAQDSYKPRQQAPQPPATGQRATTTPETPQGASVTPTGDAGEGVPLDEELTVMGEWKTPADAQAWSVQIGANENEHEARNSFKHVVDDFGGRLTKENIGAIYLTWLRKCIKKSYGVGVPA